MLCKIARVAQWKTKTHSKKSPDQPTPTSILCKTSGTIVERVITDVILIILQHRLLHPLHISPHSSTA